jgi:tetratricopeptide (TPR) repeat protein
MKNSITFGIGGLIIGLIVGFFVANSINKNAILAGIPQSQTTAPTAANPQVQNIVVRDQPANGGMMPDITEILDKAKNEPNSFEAQMKAGNTYEKIKGFDKAAAYYEQANKINPEDYDLIVKIGNTYFDARQFEKAEKWYAQALAKKPDDVNVRTDLGITFVERVAPDFDRAVKEFQTSLQNNPKHEPTLYNLGIAYFKKGDKEEAGKVLAQLEAVNPNSSLVGKLRQAINS